MKHKLNSCIASILMVGSSMVSAEIVIAPVDSRFIAPELASVSVRVNTTRINVRTTDLNGELFLACAGPEGGVIPFTQDMQLTINRSTDIVEGESRGVLTLNGVLPDLQYKMRISGTATCVPYNNLSCGQIVSELKTEGVLWVESDPTRVGILRMEMLGSVLSEAPAKWTVVNANILLGGEQDLIQGVIHSMEDGESCGV